jgi:hypothetical protein
MFRVNPSKGEESILITKGYYCITSSPLRGFILKVRPEGEECDEGGKSSLSVDGEGVRGEVGRISNHCESRIVYPEVFEGWQSQCAEEDRFLSFSPCFLVILSPCLINSSWK